MAADAWGTVGVRSCLDEKDGLDHLQARGGIERMNSRTLVLLVLGVVLVAGMAGAKGLDNAGLATHVPLPNASVTSGDFEGARLETLWIFEADFEDLTGDNAGWTSPDFSGTAAQENYWHRDTIRLTETYLGDYTWWCGTYNECWVQPRGYGNDWLMLMHRDFELSSWSVAGDDVVLDFDQRFALEHDYDYGYVDISDDGGTTWTTIYTANNPGFAGKPGTPKDWDSDQGHQALNISAWAGSDVRLRFRVETDEAYSAQDEFNNAPLGSVQDGAWQLDNFDITVNTLSVWSDDVESGDNGWVHDDLAAAGQTGLTFYRGLYGTDFETGRPFTCENRVGWMMGAVDPFTGLTIDGQYTWLISPPIDISGAEKLVGLWDMWVDLPFESNNRFDLWLASDDQEACVTSPDGFVDENPGGWYGGPFWGVWADDWDAFAGNDWLAIAWQQENQDPAAPGTHKAGIFLHRQKVGIPSGDPGTAFTLGNWDRFNDWYVEQTADALLDTALLTVKDDDDVASVFVVASGDDGATWESYPCRRLDPLGNDWNCPPPVNQMNPQTEIHYYFEATDGVGNVATYPSSAPDGYFEFSILPLEATVSDPGLLIVDKHGRATPSEMRDYFHSSAYYYREALGILGYEWEEYDVEVPSGTAQSEGPDTMAYKYYDTIAWITNQFDSFTFWTVDQQNVINWLNQAGGGKERNFFVSGNDWAYDMMAAGNETLDFVTTWLAVDYVQNGLGTPPADTLPIVKDNPGGNDFMTYDDGECILRGGCPQIEYFDVLDSQAGVTGAEVVALYEKSDATELPAGVAYTHPTLGYQTVALGFGVEFMMDSLDPSTGYYNTGVADRADLMDNIMTYFAQTPSTNPTGVVDNGFKNMLAHAQPNPFNTVTKIAYSIREAGPATIEVYNIAGKVVRTLLSSELEAGATGFVVWDGTDDAGAKCASGVYFYRMTAPNFVASHKMVMLK